MVRLLRVLILASSALLAFARAAEPTDDELKKKPITTDRGEIGKLLVSWWNDGSAAGNVGDYYDNRDGEHSPLDLRPWPQLRKFAYTEADFKFRRNWALMLPTREHVTFGNSSTSGTTQANGSNPRTAYTAPQFLSLIEKQYRGNNLYIYPEHRDHDPGHNGVNEGYGDLYPINTPYLLISQGSSGSDQPFMHRIPFTLAAFRPEVKEKLIKAGILMPTVQMILRRSNKNVSGEKDYLSGKAHPTVFEGSNVEPLKMVKLAHEITAKTIPPLVKLKVTQEDKPDAGRDYFDATGLTEQHADTASVIARISHSSAHRRKLTVSAENSLDLNKKALTFKWVVLRGDEKRIKITPKNDNGSIAEIDIAYHERRPIAAGSNMESNRVDIGVFAHNGSYYSAPAFVTFYSLDNEGRTYDREGRVVEIGYSMGEAEVRAMDQAAVMAVLGKEGLAASVLGMTAEHRKELSKVTKILAPLQEEATTARKARQDAETTRNKAQTALRDAEQKLAKVKKDMGNQQDLAAAEKAIKVKKLDHTVADMEFKAAHERLTKAEKELNVALDHRREALKMGARAFVQEALNQAMRSPTLWNDHQKALQARYDEKDSEPRRGRVDALRRKLVLLGIIEDSADKVMKFRPVVQGKGKAEERLTRYERAMIEEFNAAVLAELALPGVTTRAFRTNFVDARLGVPKNWRDVYHHDGDRVIGWTRYSTSAKAPQDFTAEGWLVTAKDEKGRPLKARTVTYKMPTAIKGGWGYSGPLEQQRGQEEITFSYEGDKRIIKSREKLFEKK